MAWFDNPINYFGNNKLVFILQGSSPVFIVYNGKDKTWRQTRNAFITTHKQSKGYMTFASRLQQ